MQSKIVENEELLLNILPAPAAARLREGDHSATQAFADVTVLFAQVAGLQDLTNRVGTDEAMMVFKELVIVFDETAERFGAEKVTTSGVSYLAVCGLSVPRPDHTTRLVDFATELLKIVERFNRERQADLKLLIGINSGPVTGGVVGRSKFIYDLWGDTVTIARGLGDGKESESVSLKMFMNAFMNSTRSANAKHEISQAKGWLSIGRCNWQITKISSRCICNDEYRSTLFLLGHRCRRRFADCHYSAHRNTGADEASWKSAHQGSREYTNPVGTSDCILLFLKYIVELPSDHTLVLATQTAVWIFGLIAALNVVNDVVFGAAQPDSWRAKVPSLFRDLTRLLLVAIGGGIIYSQVWGRSLGGAITALGVTSIVLGLALQEPLGNIVSGLMLLFERPINLGDWVNVDGVGGQVVEINWRSVHIKTFLDGVRIVPNSELYKKSFNNLSRPSMVRRVVIEIGFSYDLPPNKVKTLLLDLLKNVPQVLKDPEPLVRLSAFGDFSINYTLIIAVANSDDMGPTRDEVMTRIWYLSKRHSLEIPYPIASQIQTSKQQEIERTHVSPLDVLTSLPSFKSLVDGPLDEHLEAGLQLRNFAAKEKIVQEGTRIEGLHIVVDGEATLSVEASSGYRQQLGKVSRGEYFGECSIYTAQSSDVTVTAETDLTVIAISPDAMFRLLGKTPQLSRQLGDLMDHRRRTAMAARKSLSQS